MSKFISTLFFGLLMSSITAAYADTYSYVCPGANDVSNHGNGRWTGDLTWYNNGNQSSVQTDAGSSVQTTEKAATFVGVNIVPGNPAGLTCYYNGDQGTKKGWIQNHNLAVPANSDDGSTCGVAPVNSKVIGKKLKISNCSNPNDCALVCPDASTKKR